VDNVTLSNILEESLKAEFEKEKLGRPMYRDFSIVANRLHSRHDIDIINDPITPDNLTKIAEMVLDYVDEKIAYSTD
jgi:hypothetical protein